MLFHNIFFYHTYMWSEILQIKTYLYTVKPALVTISIKQ
jgi:hypothetical protein